MAKRNVSPGLVGIVIVAAALILRLYFLHDYVIHHSHQALAAIPFLFEPGNIAFSLASGHGFASPFRVATGPTAWMTPVWPLLLAAIFRLFGNYTYDAFLAAALLNIFFSALTCIPLFFAARRIGGFRLAVLAACLWSLFPNAIVLPYESLWEQSLAALLTTTILWATMALPESARLRNSVGYGLLWGVSLMTSAAIASLLPFLLGWLAWRRGSAKASLAGIVALLCCIPWTVRNYAALHAFVPLRSVAGLSLWVGNNERADGLSTTLHPISNSAERAKYVELGEIAYMREKREEAFAFMAAHPAAELRLIYARLTATWTGGSTSPISDFLKGHGEPAQPTQLSFRWTLLCNVAATFFGAAGLLVLFLKRNPFAYPVAMLPVIFPLPYYVTLAMPRYRHPIDPALLLLTACALQAIWQTISRGSKPLQSSETDIT